MTGVKHAEKQKIEEAIKCFTEAIEILPDYPSAYNNRAQAFRMKAMNMGKIYILLFVGTFFWYYKIYTIQGKFRVQVRRSLQKH